MYDPSGKPSADPEGNPSVRTITPLGDGAAVIDDDRAVIEPTASAGEPRRRPGTVEAIAALFLLAVVLQTPLQPVLDAPWFRTWTTILLSVLTQAMPFLVLGVALSAAIAVLVPASFFARALPGHPA